MSRARCPSNGPFQAPPRPRALGVLELEPEDYEALGLRTYDLSVTAPAYAQKGFVFQEGGRGYRNPENVEARRARRKGYRRELHVRETTRIYDREYGQRPDVKLKKSERYDRWADSAAAKERINARARRYRAKLKKLGKKVVRKKPYKRRKSRAKPR